MLRRILMGAGVVTAIALVVGVGIVAWVKLSPRNVPEGQAPLATIDATSLPDFRDAFNGGVGSTRVLVLLSPT